MLLLDGISRFLINDLSEVDSIQFNKLCFSVANLTHGKLVSFEKPDEIQNFYKAELKLNDESIFILLNSSYPIVAFASSVEYCNIKFIALTLSRVIYAFSNDYTIAAISELVEQLAIDERTQTVLNENNLNKSEISQILYWRPKTVGDVVFNFWD